MDLPLFASVPILYILLQSAFDADIPILYILLQSAFDADVPILYILLQSAFDADIPILTSSLTVFCTTIILQLARLMDITVFRATILLIYCPLGRFSSF